ncbi:hypothetical protein CC2G_007101 [Coprinopsis cinerea AmutBmut pab1-1]|nr:hypothetical protein CC2G_007101 [Coprinopsis cinerea AmutBmut pab1-1]
MHSQSSRFHSLGSFVLVLAQQVYVTASTMHFLSFEYDSHSIEWSSDNNPFPVYSLGPKGGILGRRTRVKESILFGLLHNLGSGSKHPSSEHLTNSGAWIHLTPSIPYEGLGSLKSTELKDYEGHIPWQILTATRSGLTSEPDKLHHEMRFVPLHRDRWLGRGPAVTWALRRPQRCVWIIAWIIMEVAGVNNVSVTSLLER